MTFIPKQLHLLQHWITERERVRVLHDSKPQPPRPWTKDKVLSTYSFCNVRRMDDRVSKWLMNKWYVHGSNHESLLVQATLARLINEPRTLACLAPPVSPWRKADEEFWAATLEKLHRTRDIPTFTSAYLVIGTEFSDGKCVVIPRIASRVAEKARLIVNFSTMAGMHYGLMKIKGLGSFLAGQITADMRHLRGTAWASDRMKWAPLGPGSRRGLARLINGTPKGLRISQEAFQNTLVDLRSRLTLPPHVEAMDLQNCLCEFDKYCRAVTDGYRPRRLYRGGRSAQGVLPGV